MHLVFVTSLVPDGNPATGYEIANAAVIDALRRQGVRVTVFGFTWPNKTPSDPENTVVLGSVDVETHSASAITKIKWLATAITRGLTVSAAKLRNISDEDVRSALEKIGPFDACVLNGVSMPGAFETVFKDHTTLFVAHNVEHRSAAENAEAAGSLLQKWLYRREAGLLAELEQRLCNAACFVYTFAEEDRQALNIADEQRSAALPLVTGTRPVSDPSNRTVTYDAALIGTWTWQPNRIGLDWFLNEVVPHLEPDFSIAIAGRLPQDLQPKRANITLTGRVPDARDFVSRAAVIPLISRAGTGVQLKTIETFELGLPSVATQHSVRGISHVPANCTVCDNPAEFARKLEETARAVRDGRIAEVDAGAFTRAQTDTLDQHVELGLRSLARQAGVLTA